MIIITDWCDVCGKPKFLKFMYQFPQILKKGHPLLTCESCHRKIISGEIDLYKNITVGVPHNDH